MDRGMSFVCKLKMKFVEIFQQNMLFFYRMMMKRHLRGFGMSVRMSFFKQCIYRSWMYKFLYCVVINFEDSFPNGAKKKNFKNYSL